MQSTVRPARVLSALMLIAIVNVYVFANGALASSNKTVYGRLVTTSNRPVLVNGGDAITGTIIVSGSELSTSSVNMATVEIPNVAVVSIAPSSQFTLTFNLKDILVKEASGDAVLKTADGVTGSVVDAAGTPKTAAAPAGGNSARNWGIAGVAVGSAAFIWAIIAWNRANDARDSAAAANAAAASLASQLAALRACLAKQTTSPVSLCTSF